MQRNIKGQFVRGTNGRTFEGFGVWDDAKGYPCIWIDGKSVKLHVYVWERVNGSKPPRYLIHHKDFDKANFALENLESMTESNHRRVHAGWVRDTAGAWVAKPCTHCKRALPLSSFYPRKGHTPTALCRPCHNAVCSERNKTIPEKRRIYNQHWYAKRKGVMPHASK